MDKRKMAALVLSAWLALGTAAVASPEGNAVPEQEDVAAGQAGGSSEPSKQGGSPQSDEQEVHQPPKAQPEKPPTKPPASGAETKIKKMEGDLKKHGDELQNMKNSLAPAGAWTGKVLAASLGVSVLGLGFGALATIKASKAKVAAEKLSAQVKRLQMAQEALGNRPEYITGVEFDETIDNLRKQIGSLSRPAQPSAAPVAARGIAASQQGEDPDAAWRPFVEAYNSLMQRAKSMQGMEAKNARTGFISQYSVQAFKCVNFQSRVSHPELPPQFADESPVTGSFWAIPVRGDQYAVVPNLKTYEAQIHDTGGMKEAFHSNFVPGKTFNSITVVRPAIFAAGWTLREPGELRLS